MFANKKHVSRPSATTSEPRTHVTSKTRTPFEDALKRKVPFAVKALLDEWARLPPSKRAPAMKHPRDSKQLLSQAVQTYPELVVQMLSSLPLEGYSHFLKPEVTEAPASISIATISAWS